MAVLKAVDPDPVHAEATETVEEVTETEKTEEAQEIREIRADSEIFPEKNRHPDLDINHIFFSQEARFSTEYLAFYCSDIP